MMNLDSFSICLIVFPFQKKKEKKKRIVGKSLFKWNSLLFFVATYVGHKHTYILISMEN